MWLITNFEDVFLVDQAKSTKGRLHQTEVSSIEYALACFHVNGRLSILHEEALYETAAVLLGVVTSPGGC